MNLKTDLRFQLSRIMKIIQPMAFYGSYNFFRWKLSIEPGPPKFWISDELDRSVLGSLLSTLEVCKWTYTLTPHRRKTLILSESVSTIVLQSDERRFVMSPVFVVSKNETSCLMIQLKIQFILILTVMHKKYFLY